MAQEKNETSFFKKIIDEKHVLGKDVTYQKLNNYLGGQFLLTRIETETNRAFRKDILLQRLAQFAFEGKITQLHTYAKNYDSWTEEQKEKYWCTIVGLAQSLIPAHIRHHYCDPEEAFWNNPNFKKPKLKRSLQIYN